jgi:hypothetical protein
MPAVNGVGEPGAGEPHARFEVAGAGNGAKNLTTGTRVAQPFGKPAEHEGPRALTQEKPPRQLPTRQRAAKPVCDTPLTARLPWLLVGNMVLLPASS